MAHGRVTITDVAREAGVSIATVSRVIAGRGSVSPALAERVRQTAERLGYRPSPLARSLATGETGMVGVLVPQLASPYFAELVKAIGASARDDGYHMLVLECDDRPQDEAELAASLYTRVDGMILCSPRMPEGDLERLAVGRPRLLCLNRIPSGAAPLAIAHGIADSMLRMCELLRDLGHRRLAFLSGRPDSWANCERWRAIERAAALGLDPTYVPAGPGIDEGYRATDVALAAEPTALVATSDPAALGALSRLRELGRRVPEDISVTGYGDINFAHHANPPLTTVRVHRLELGAQAWSMMRSLIAGEPVADRPPVRPGEVVVRASTGPAGGRDY